MKICILANFVFPHCGGSENVLKNVADILVRDYNYEISVYGFSCKVPFSKNCVKYFPCPRGNALISEISKFDHTLIYSDSFWEYGTVVKNIEKVSHIVSVCLVGGYHMQSHPEIFNLLKKNIDKFNLITHSKMTPDYKWCIDNGLPVKVIPNGVNLNFFRENKISFREKYDIKSKHIILNVSSFFFGKGFELLPKIARKIESKDFIIIQCSNSVQYPYDKVFLERTKQQSKGLPIRFLRDLPREDIIAAFQQSDVFLQVSKKEVAPLVILESRSAKLPYVSMDVGNTKENPGGIIINNSKEDHKGYKVVDSKVINHFAVAIEHLLNMPRMRQAAIDEGQQDIEKIDWDNIVKLYNEVFSK